MATNLELSFNNPLIRGLACAALSPGLRSILIFDYSPDELRSLSNLLGQMLKIVTGKEVESVVLGTIEAEDDLWGSFSLQYNLEDIPLGWKRGILTTRPEDTKLKLAVIPNLARLNLSVARACVILMGADIANLERHGQQDFWKPNLCWLASCPRDEIGAVSPHLLDRFALRLTGKRTKNNPTTIEQILSWLEGSKVETSIEEFLPQNIEEALLQALQSLPQVTEEALDRVLDWTSFLENNGSRRSLALARLALANARLEGLKEVKVSQVDTAAQLIGLKQEKSSIQKDPIETPSETSQSKNDLQQPSPDPISAPAPAPSLPKSSTVREPVYEPDGHEEQSEMPLSINTNPYPEDNAPIAREAASLQLPLRRFQGKASDRGTIIGAERATKLRDLALVRTVLEAAKFQTIRHKQGKNRGNRLILSPTDLYCYRRAPVAEQMLVLVLDYTCLQNCNWQETLLPYLSWAYVERASACLIQVGAANASDELRSQKIMAQNILVPRFSQGLDLEGGRATPLAHGLDLALQTLRHALQHGRSRVHQVQFVIISDGRGNVPLTASYTGQIQPPVKREGVEDALKVAECIQTLDRVEAVFLSPQPKRYPDLPLELAQAMGAQVALIPPLKQQEGENAIF